jgi:hypothetical protein
MNTYTCPKYLREVLEEIMLYFELQKYKFMAVYEDKFLFFWEPTGDLRVIILSDQEKADGRVQSRS